MSNYIDTEQEYYWYEYYNDLISDSAVFDIALHEISASFHFYYKDFKYVKDEFTLQVLRNYPFALRGYPFKNRRLRKYYESQDWFEANAESTFTTKDLSIEEFKWIQNLSVFMNDDN